LRKRVRVDDIVDLVQRRIHFGDYTLVKMPTEVELAAEVGACRMTARRAVTKLIEKGVLVRPPNGRIQLRRDRQTATGRMNIGILAPAWISAETTRYRFVMEHLAEQFDASLRSLEYRHWDDAVFGEALDSFDGLFVHPAAEVIPPEWIDLIRAAKKPVAVVGWDLSALGIPSLDLAPASAFDTLFEHFRARGHRQLDCLNTQPLDGISARIQRWQQWRAERGIAGQLFNAPVQSYEDHVKAAYRLVKAMLADGSFQSPALFCTTTASAEAVLRALYEAGIKVGVDVAISGANDSDQRAWLNCPSLTVMESPDPTPYLAVCFEWMARGGKNWTGPLLMVPRHVPLFIGESTGGAVAAGQKPMRQ